MNLSFTILAAILIMAFVVVALLSGYLLTGKIKLRKRCGMAPKEGKGPCPLCGTKDKCEKEKDDSDQKLP